MEMEMEAAEDVSLPSLTERLTAAVATLEQMAISGVNVQASSREAELEERLEAAEQTIATLKGSGRKTGPTAGTLMAKEGPGFDAAGVDAALVSLNVEQRIAVKSGLMRAGLLG